MISRALKLPNGARWQLAIWQLGNFRPKKHETDQQLGELGKLPTGNLATSVLATWQSQSLFDFNGLGKLPSCRTKPSPYGGDGEPLKVARSSHAPKLVGADPVLCPACPVCFPTLLITEVPMMHEPCPVTPDHYPVKTMIDPPFRSVLLALDLGTSTGYALRLSNGQIVSGTISFRPTRYDGGGMRFVRFGNWLDRLTIDTPDLIAVYFEEVRRHVGTDAAHLYGGFLATLTAWCEMRGLAYQGVPVGTIKRHVTSKGNADKASMLSAIRARGFNPADDNEADAIAILIWAIETSGGVR